MVKNKLRITIILTLIVFFVLLGINVYINNKVTIFTIENCSMYIKSKNIIVKDNILYIVEDGNYKNKISKSIDEKIKYKDNILNTYENDTALISLSPTFGKNIEYYLEGQKFNFKIIYNEMNKEVVIEGYIPATSTAMTTLRSNETQLSTYCVRFISQHQVIKRTFEDESTTVIHKIDVEYLLDDIIYKDEIELK